MKAIHLLISLSITISLSGQVLTYTDLKEGFLNLGSVRTAEILLNRDFKLIEKKNLSSKNYSKASFHESWAFNFDPTTSKAQIWVHCTPDRLTVFLPGESYTYTYLIDKIKQYCSNYELQATNYDYARYYIHNEEFAFKISYNRSSGNEEIHIMSYMDYWIESELNRKFTND